MKQFILAALICISTFGAAQSTTKERTITTYGSVVIESDELLYKTDVTLSLENSYYADNPCTTLDELKAKYFLNGGNFFFGIACGRKMFCRLLCGSIWER